VLTKEKARQPSFQNQGRERGASCIAEDSRLGVLRLDRWGGEERKERPHPRGGGGVLYISKWGKEKQGGRRSPPLTGKGGRHFSTKEKGEEDVLLSFHRNGGEKAMTVLFVTQEEGKGGGSPPWNPSFYSNWRGGDWRGGGWNPGQPTCPRHGRDGELAALEREGELPRTFVTRKEKGEALASLFPIGEGWGGS